MALFNLNRKRELPTESEQPAPKRELSVGKTVLVHAADLADYGLPMLFTGEVSGIEGDCALVHFVIDVIDGVEYSAARWLKKSRMKVLQAVTAA